jgi:hypothetical protein
MKCLGSGGAEASACVGTIFSDFTEARIHTLIKMVRKCREQRDYRIGQQYLGENEHDLAELISLEDELLALIARKAK